VYNPQERKRAYHVFKRTDDMKPRVNLLHLHNVWIVKSVSFASARHSILIEHLASEYDDDTVAYIPI